MNTNYYSSGIISIPKTSVSSYLPFSTYNFASESGLGQFLKVYGHDNPYKTRRKKTKLFKMDEQKKFSLMNLI